MEVIHTCIWVDDIDEVREFYVETLGLEENWSFTLDGTTNVYVGGEDGEIQFKYNPDHSVDKTRDRSRLDHIAIEVDDLDDMLDHVSKTTDVPVIDGPRTVDPAEAYIAFIEDPQGYVVELVELLS